MALPCGTTGSLCSTFVPDRPVCLSVKLPYAIALYARLPSVLWEPLEASVTLLEATTPVKLTPHARHPATQRTRSRTQHREAPQAEHRRAPPQRGVRSQVRRAGRF